MFRRLFRAIFSTIGILIVVSLILCALIWFFGPLLAIGEWRPFDSELGRYITIGVIAALTIIGILTILLLRRRRDRDMTDAIVKATATPQDEGDAAVKAEVAEMRDRLREALTMLRRSKLGGRFTSRHLYQLPWYIIIGPPGAGKTTAIVNSGLEFPLAEKMGKTAIGGVGGTRNCDWWFTNDAVLLDTAGRYTTQDSDKEQDAGAWTGFLDMLKKYRKRQPINGALVAISLSDLSMQDDAQRAAHARAIRSRLLELRQRLGVRFPVYILFTKADLIAGFSEYFDSLGKEERGQVWGFTLPFDKKAEGPMLARFDMEFDALLDRLNDRSVERMQGEIDHQRRSLVQAFPSQVASLKTVAREFLSDVFQESRFEDRPLLRGVYFTSGTQEGTPIDRLMMGMARTFGIGRQAIGSGTGTGRSFFLTKLLKDVIFGEAGLVSKDDRVERRYRWIRNGAIAASLVVLTALGTLWTISFLGNDELVAEARASVDEYQELVAALPAPPIGDDAMERVVPPLNILRDMPGNPALGDPAPAWDLQWGLWQGDAIGTEAAQTYRSALNQIMLPRMLVRLENQLQANLNNPELLYSGLKVYLMLGLEGPMDRDLITQWKAIDWSLRYPGQDELRADLERHLAQLLDQPMQKIALNGPLVEQIQALLSETPLAERIYNGIISSPEARALPQWRLTDIGGPATSRVLLRSSGAPLSEGIEGIFTHSGFYGVFLPNALEVADRIRRESWVLGPRGALEQTPGALTRLTRDVLNLYYNDYIQRYDAVLGDVDIVPMESLSHAVEVTNVLSGPTSPIRNILVGVSQETRLATPAGGVLSLAGLSSGSGEAVSSFAISEAISTFDARTQALLSTLRNASEAEGAAGLAGGGAAAREALPGQYVQERFNWLHELVVSPEGVPSGLEDIIATMTEVYRELNRMAIQPGAGGVLAQAAGATGDGGAVSRLLEATGRLPGPLQRWSTQIAQGASGITAGGARAGLNQQWQAKVLPLCEKAIDGRYPFDRNAQADVAIQDFTRLFAPNGLIDSFFNENLISFVDTSSKPWSWRRVNNADLGISAAVLTQFERAAEIRDSFFLGGGPPSVTFDLKPIALAPDATQVTLEIEGQSLAYAHGPPQVTPLQWPGQAGGRSRVALQPELAGVENSMAREGPWAWFRLLDAAEVRRTNVSDRSRVVFNVGGRIAVFELRAGSALNPFSLPALGAFRCPRSL